MLKTLYILDGHAQIYAAYYASTGANLSSPAGEPTKATYIFTTIILKLLKGKKPDFLAVAMDSPGPTFRHELYDQYKANRPAMPEDLPPQIKRIDQILAALGITAIGIGGFEADDIIGTLARLGQDQDLEIYICSKDKDFEQLLRPGVAMFDLQKDAILDADKLMETKGITPDQVIDILALSGDAADNIPGVPDVGQKTARQWIREYGALETLLAQSDQIKGKRGDNLRAHCDQARLSRELATINQEVPLNVGLDDLAIGPIDQPALKEVFQQLGFHKLLTQLDLAGDVEEAGSPSDSIDAPSVEQAPLISHLIDSPEAFEEFFQKLNTQRAFAIDTETTALNPVNAQLVGMSFSWQAGEAYYLPFRVPLGQKCLDMTHTLDRLGPCLTDSGVKKSGQNIKYDLIVLERAGVRLAGVNFDTMVASYLLDPARARHNLDSLAKDYLGHETIAIESLIGKGKKQVTFDMVEPRLAADYAAEDAEVTWRLTKLFEEMLGADDQIAGLFQQVEMPLVEVLSQMELHGVAIDITMLKKLSTTMSRRSDALIDQIYEQAGRSFNVDSPMQLAQVLFTDLDLVPVKKGKSGPSTDHEVLETLRWQHPIAALMLEYRQLSKLKNTYVDKLPSMISPQTGRIHASFNQAVAATGRLSSSHPNLQNIPIRSDLGREIRRAFVAPDDQSLLLAADYSQIELRMLAHFSQDPGLLEAFESGLDIHRFVAAKVNKLSLEEVDAAQRDKAKAVNFGIIYGQTPFGLSRSIGMPVDEAKRFIDDYFDRYPSIKAFMDDIITNAKKTGYVKTILGRRRALPDLNARNVSRRKLSERMAVNTVIQGSAADLIKVAMVNIHRRIAREKLDLKMILQVHDELLFELPQNQAKNYSEIIRNEMSQALDLKVPITVALDTGPNWLECK